MFSLMHLSILMLHFLSFQKKKKEKKKSHFLSLMLFLYIYPLSSPKSQFEKDKVVIFHGPSGRYLLIFNLACEISAKSKIVKQAAGF